MRNKWTDERITSFGIAYAMALVGELPTVAGMFGLAHAKSARATACWLRSKGYDIVLRV